MVMALEMAQYNASTNQAANTARLRYARLNNSSLDKQQDFINESVEYADEKLEESLKKQELNFRRRVEKMENDKANQDLREFYDIATGNRLLAPVKVIELAIKSREAVKNHEKHAWFLPFFVALMMDGVLSIVSEVISASLPIPVFSPGKLMLLCGWIYLFIFSWGTHNKIKIKIFIFILGFFEIFIPLIEILPISTFAIYLSYKKSKEISDQGETDLVKVKEEYPELVIS